MTVLQTVALPLGYGSEADTIYLGSAAARNLSGRRRVRAARRERIRAVAALQLRRRPHRAALGEDRDAHHADVAIARGLRRVRLGDAAEPERRDLRVRG